MNYGYVRVAAAVPNLEVSNCEYNTDRIIELIKEADKENVQIVVFPELSITSYTCGDLFHQQLLLQSAQQQLGRLLNETKELNIVSIVGIPVAVDNQLFNCAAIVQSGNILAVIPKTYIPNYNEFYESRWFSSSNEAPSKTINLCNRDVPFSSNILMKCGTTLFAVELCEDVWAPIPPSSYHCLMGANIIFNSSASNEIIGKSDYRIELIKQQSARCISGYVYTSSGGGESTTDLVFGGHAMIAENGSILSESKRFETSEQLIINEIDIQRLMVDRRKSNSFMKINKSNAPSCMDYSIINCNLKTNNIDESQFHRTIDAFPFVPQDTTARDKRCEEIFSIQVAGLSKRLSHTNSKSAIIGISGGLDSTLATLVTVKAFDKLNIPRSNIIGITMPGFGTTGRTYKNAINFMKLSGITMREIDIKEACVKHFKDIGHNSDVHDTTYENVQARERTQILMDIANKETGLVIGTGDLSELALGWATYNGDHMSMYSVNSGVPKTLVRYLVKWVADNDTMDKIRKILIDILDTPVSPELLPADSDGEICQKTEDIVGPYELHDFFLYQMVRFGFSPDKILFHAQKAFNHRYSREIILKWLQVFYKRFFSQQFKRSCLPDGPKVGSINLSPRGDWRMPSDASSKIWMDEIEKLK